MKKQNYQNISIKDTRNTNYLSREDCTCLAEGLVVPADPAVTGINLNELIVGTTGSGKTVSNGESRILHTYHSSLVIPIAKKSLKVKYIDLLKKRGYEIYDLDFAKPENCTTGYDPMDYIKRDEDVIQLARNLIVNQTSPDMAHTPDPYWEDSSISILAAEIALVRLNAKAAHKAPHFSDVIKLHRSFQLLPGSFGGIKTTLDPLFEDAERRYPGNPACELFKTIQNLAPKTASCIFSIVNTAIDKICSENILRMSRKRKRIQFKTLGEKKCAVFFTISPMNKTLRKYINIMYADMFRALFESAEDKENGRLQVPVHIICDDFACSGRIADFEEYISIFRAAGISVSLFLQSESQLISMYRPYAATTIINNCDTYVYLGGMDEQTCNSVARRCNKPLHEIMQLKPGNVIVFRRGHEPVIARRYQTYEDEIYKEMKSEQNVEPSPI